MGYNGCEVHLKPEGRCPNDGQECSFNWYDDAPNPHAIPKEA